MLAHLSIGEVFDHPGSCGAATEQGWIELFTRYLPRRYRVSPAFVVDADGRRSRQIDVAVYDNFYSPLIFSHESGMHIPAESVYAVFEVKQLLTRQLILDAGRKAASVRVLRRTSAPIISAGGRRAPVAPSPIVAGILASTSAWPNTFQQKVSAILPAMPGNHRLDLGCALRQGGFELEGGAVRFSTPEESLIFFILRLLDRLRALGTAPALDLAEYGRSLTSFSGEVKTS